MIVGQWTQLTHVTVVGAISAVANAAKGKRLNHHLCQAVVDVDASTRGPLDQDVLNRLVRGVDVQGQRLLTGVDEVHSLISLYTRQGQCLETLGTRVFFNAWHFRTFCAEAQVTMGRMGPKISSFMISSSSLTSVRTVISMYLDDLSDLPPAWQRGGIKDQRSTTVFAFVFVFYLPIATFPVVLLSMAINRSKCFSVMILHWSLDF